jgi:hypothetical protein
MAAATRVVSDLPIITGLSLLLLSCFKFLFDEL